MRIKGLIISILLVVSAFFVPQALAAGCVPIYGGGPTCTDTSLTIQKQVLNPTTNKFVHDLGMSDPKYQAQDLVSFQIILTNNGNKPMQKVTVKDSFPGILSFTDGPGQFDKSSNTLTFEVNNLAAHHSQLFTISARVVSQDKFPSQNVSCVNNRVSALPSSGSVVEDSSQFCIEKLTTTPATGPEALDLLALFPTAALGFFLLKSSIINHKS